MTHVHQLIFFAHFWCLFFWDNIWQIFNFHWLQNACRKRSVANMKRRKFAPSAEMSFVFSLCLRMWTRKCVCFGFGCVARVCGLCVYLYLMRHLRRCPMALAGYCWRSLWAPLEIKFVFTKIHSCCAPKVNFYN